MFNALMWLLTLALCAFSGAYFYVEKTLPNTDRLKHEFPIVVIDSKTKQRKVKFEKERPEDWIRLEKISEHVVNAVVVSEDWAFYQHNGYDLSQIKEAFVEIFKGERVRGASTITQQVAKNVFLSMERSLWRKFREFVLALKLERDLSKQKILETYLNIVEFGPDIYGVSKASLYYFQNSPELLNPKEAAFLAMLLPSPIRYGESYRNRELTKFARATIKSILSKMVQAKYLTSKQMLLALQTPLVFEDSFEELDNYTSETEALDETGPEEESHGEPTADGVDSSEDLPSGNPEAEDDIENNLEADDGPSDLSDPSDPQEINQ